MFKSSARELKNLKTVTAMALLIALHTVLSFLSINISTSLRVSVSFTANCIAGLFFGPVAGLISGGLGDIVGYITKPTGPFFPGWTLNAALAGLAYGIAFYKKYPKAINDNKNIKDKKDNEDKKDNKDNKDIKDNNMNKYTDNKSNKKSEDKNDYKNTKKGTRIYICSLIAQIAVQLSIFTWLFLPFISLKNLNNSTEVNAMIFEKKSIYSILSRYSGNVNNSIRILLIVLIIIFFILIYANTMKNKLVPAQIALYTACITALTLYEYRKKAIVSELGFYIIIAMLLLIAILNFIIILSKKNLDMLYLLRCFIVMAFVAVVINGLLGTYWCTIMYGSKFMVYFIPRIVKNLLQLPINTILAYVIIREIKSKNMGKYLLGTIHN